MPLDLTIAIPVRNEEKCLLACLDAIGKDFAARVVVLDSQSNDKTPELARQWGANVFDFHWNGLFPKKRNWFLRNHPPSTSWVLFLDADEILTPTFKDELSRVLPTSKLNGYWLRYSIYFMGRELRFGYPLKKLALFRVGCGEYERIAEGNWTKMDMEIHEHPQIEGELGEIKAKIDHRDFHGIAHYVAKHNEYSTWEAHRFTQMTGSANQENVQLTWKQKLKYRIAGTPLAGIIYFIGAYVFMGGFLDGVRGLTFAILKMSYFTQVYCKVQELKGQK